MFRRMLSAIRTYGLAGLFPGLKRQLLRSRLRCFGTLEPMFTGKSGLEIGGPSGVFARGGFLPLYPVVNTLDNCNFSGTTLWEGAIREGRTFRFDPDKAPGTQYLMEASSLDAIGEEQYDFVLSSHTLEHSSNPLRVLSEISRVLKRGGVLVLLLPHKERTFDHRRQVTSIDHLINDYTENMPESDLTHMPEILSCHDLSMDPAAGDFESFKARSQRNYENRCLHHHVFSTRSAVEMIDWMGMELVGVETAVPHHIVIVARKSDNAGRGNNASFLKPGAEYLKRSPFALDHE